jgi:hypothetical protein
MVHFYFNDCYPSTEREDLLVKLLEDSISHYSKIKKEYAEFIVGIITYARPKEIILKNQNFSLADCIKYLKKDSRKFAYASFNKYPIEDYLALNDIDSLISGTYTITLDKTSYNALNSKIVQENNGSLFSIPVVKDLRNNILTIQEQNTSNPYEVNNLYGEASNTEYLLNFVRDEFLESLYGFDKFRALIGNCSYLERFKDDYNSLSSSIQKKLIDTIENAINRKLPTRFSSDNDVIKDITPDKEKSIKIYELRIFTPATIRLYFYETTTKIYFGGLEKKPKPRVQNQDILNAISTIKGLIAMD